MERGRRLELLLSAWKAEAQPLDQPREMVDTKRIELFTASVQTTLAPLVHACPLRWSEWQVSNLRPHAPKARALTKLRYTQIKINDKHLYNEIGAFSNKITESLGACLNSFFIFKFHHPFCQHLLQTFFQVYRLSFWCVLNFHSYSK